MFNAKSTTYNINVQIRPPHQDQRLDKFACQAFFFVFFVFKLIRNYSCLFLFRPLFLVGFLKIHPPHPDDNSSETTSPDRLDTQTTCRYNELKTTISKRGELISLITFPNIICEKRAIPSIYLDSCAIIELARYNIGEYKGPYEKEIGEFFTVISSMMKEHKILCPYGNQLSEVGMTANRAPARNFLYQFTNDRLFPPECIRNNQLHAGYQSFSKQENKIELKIDDAYDFDASSISPFKVFASPIYSKEKAKTFSDEKLHIADILNNIKRTGQPRKSFEEQLMAELETDFIMFKINNIENPMSTEEDYLRYTNEMAKFRSITGFYDWSDHNQFCQETARYIYFFKSLYHHFLPYIWTQSNLWAHLMQRQNNIKKSDNLDIKWASAYLPYVDFAVTDTDFCRVLNETGIANQYDVKVYSFSTLKELLNELNSMV